MWTQLKGKKNIYSLCFWKSPVFPLCFTKEKWVFFRNKGSNYHTPRLVSALVCWNAIFLKFRLYETSYLSFEFLKRFPIQNYTFKYNFFHVRMLVYKLIKLPCPWFELCLCLFMKLIHIHEKYGVEKKWNWTHCKLVCSPVLVEPVNSGSATESRHWRTQAMTLTLFLGFRV